MCSQTCSSIVVSQDGLQCEYALLVWMRSICSLSHACRLHHIIGLFAIAAGSQQTPCLCRAPQSVCQKTGKKVVTAILEDGRRFEGDILIGADGIWSKVCSKACCQDVLTLLTLVPDYQSFVCSTCWAWLGFNLHLLLSDLKCWLWCGTGAAEADRRLAAKLQPVHLLHGHQRLHAARHRHRRVRRMYFVQAIFSLTTTLGGLAVDL